LCSAIAYLLYARSSHFFFFVTDMEQPSILFAERITVNPAVCAGKPTIRNMRFTVAQMLELLASSMTIDEILVDYPFLEREDVSACLEYAARMANAKTLLLLPTALAA
jgi:uncharacterized protein (DUF433 family)